MRFWITMMMAAGAMAARGADEPVRMAAAGRVQVIVPDGMAPLAEVRVTGGTAGDAGWLGDPGKRERMTDITFPVDWWRTREIGIAFTPREDGEIELMLGGVWAEREPGVLWREEVVWEGVSGEGTAVENGDFREAGEGAPKGWNSPWRPYPAADEWPLSGGGVAASWQARPLVGKLAVAKGRPVRLSLKARAAAPPGFSAPKRLSGETAAHRYAAKLKRGVNLGNGWEAPPGKGWGIRYDAADVDRIADQGFDHIRVPVAWHYRMEDGGISPEFLAKLDPVLRRALERKLRVIINWHHFDDLIADPAAHRASFAEGWRRIAAHYADWPGELCLELYNEPRAPLEGELLNSILAEGIAAVRESNPERTVMVNPTGWGSVTGLGQLRLPDGEENVVVSVHCYEPFHFTHQGANWVDLTELKGVVFPGPPAVPLVLPDSLKDKLGGWAADYNRLAGAENPSSSAVFERLLDDAVEWSRVFGRPVHLGEFGAYRAADEASRGRYARAMRGVREKRGLAWCWWEWKSGFAYWDDSAGRPLLREELIGK